jgi:hypothetical protein
MKIDVEGSEAEVLRVPRKLSDSIAHLVCRSDRRDKAGRTMR